MTVWLTSSFLTSSGTEGSWLPDGNFPSRIQPSRVSLTSSVSLFLCGGVSSGINTDDRTSNQSYQWYVQLSGWVVNRFGEYEKVSRWGLASSGSLTRWFWTAW